MTCTAARRCCASTTSTCTRRAWRTRSAFWLALGFRCSEYISTDDAADERITGAWLLRKPTVHDVALTAGTGPRLHHFAYWIAEPAGVLRACDQLAGGYHADVIERGPGRHGVSNAFFVYLRDPDGHRIELYSCDYYTGDPDHEPLRWSVNDPRCRSFYGTRAPGQLVRGVKPAARPRRRARRRSRPPTSTSARSTARWRPSGGPLAMAGCAGQWRCLTG